MEGILESFVEYLISAGKSKCTIESYSLDIKQFFEFINDTSISIKSIKYSDLINWSNFLEKSGFSTATRARKISAIKSFFRYLYKSEYISKNPAEMMESPKILQKAPKVISEESAKVLLGQTDNNKITSFRDYAIVAMFLFTGIRREELTNISLNNINLDNRTICIHGKGNKERFVYINDSLFPIIQEYLSTYRERLKTSKNSKFLFPSIKREQLSLNSINNIVNKAFIAAGIKEKGVGAHILRKRFATTVFTNTHDIGTVSKLLGHSSSVVTTRYVIINEDILRDATTSVNF